MYFVRYILVSIYMIFKHMFSLNKKNMYASVLTGHIEIIQRTTFLIGLQILATGQQDLVLTDWFKNLYSKAMFQIYHIYHFFEQA